MVMECNCSSKPVMLTVLGLCCMGVEPRGQHRGKIPLTPTSPHKPRARVQMTIW